VDWTGGERQLRSGRERMGVERRGKERQSRMGRDWTGVEWQTRLGWVAHVGALISLVGPGDVRQERRCG